MKDLLEFQSTGEIQCEDDKKSTYTKKETIDKKDPEIKNKKQEVIYKDKCKKRCYSHKTKEKYYNFPKLTPNIDFILPVILDFLKEHTGNSSYFIELAQKEVLAKKEGSRKSSEEDLLFYLRMCRKSDVRVKGMLSGLCEYLDFRFHSPKSSNVNIRFIFDKLDKEIRLLCKTNLYKIHLPIDIPVFKSDPECLFNVFRYLIKNSIERGQKSYKKIVIHVKIKRTKGKIIFHLQDNGDSIPEKEQLYFFSLFEGKNHMDSGAMETAISRKYIQSLGGEMWIESSNNLKTLISFYLPDRE